MASIDRDALCALVHSVDEDIDAKLPAWVEAKVEDVYCFSNWDADAELPTWHGVKVNDADRVVELSLSFNILRGLQSTAW